MPLKHYNRAVSVSPTNVEPDAKHMRTSPPPPPPPPPQQAQQQANTVDDADNAVSSSDASSSATASGSTSASQSIAWVSKPANQLPVVLFTGFDALELHKHQRTVIGLGGIMAKQCSHATHLVVDKIERTAKLLKCISHVRHIVHVSWLHDSKHAGRFVDAGDARYAIRDERFESHYGCSLSESLRRARESLKPLFAGLSFYMSPSVRPSYDELAEMIRSAGGTVLADVPPVHKLAKALDDQQHTASVNSVNNECNDERRKVSKLSLLYLLPGYRFSILKIKNKQK